ncbi:uncharacterized protein LOC110455030 isoform X2 [Mizuhopecten yessoensis]|uniref:uncharacterized protein LOC110455030 isoform X2 n=1 Tax=Mizuhopecten yessoensis TaxID=6573 RepID=UPI000B45DFCA|nr:uncharacterized protein LOC110455030 isoform X2 [Mizuhopecten yessoensis]
MNEEDKSKITENLTVLRESVMISIHPILHTLIEKGVFKFEFLAQFDQISDRHNQFSKFISFLTSSGHKLAYSTFKTALKAEGFHNLVETMERTEPDPNRTIHSEVESATAAGAPGGELLGAMKEMFADAERKHEERMKRIVEDVSHIRKKQTEAELLRQEDQKHLHELHELNKRTLGILQQSSGEEKHLREEFTRLQEIQKEMRQTDNDRLLRLRGKNFEIQELNCMIKKTEKQLEEKIEENSTLKKTICDQYEKLQSILEKQNQTLKVRTVNRQVNQAVEEYKRTGIIDLNFQISLRD